jgi:hypothetical protein
MAQAENRGEGPEASGPALRASPARAAPMPGAEESSGAGEPAARSRASPCNRIVSRATSPGTGGASASDTCRAGSRSSCRPVRRRLRHNPPQRGPEAPPAARTPERWLGPDAYFHMLASVASRAKARPVCRGQIRRPAETNLASLPGQWEIPSGTGVAPVPSFRFDLQGARRGEEEDERRQRRQ